MTTRNLSTETQSYLEAASDLAFDHGQDQVYPEHVLAVLVSERSQKTRNLITGAGGHPDEIREVLQERIESLGRTLKGKNAVRFSRGMSQVFSTASRIRQRLAEQRISPDILLLALLSAMGSELDIKTDRMRRVMEKRELILEVNEKIKGYVANEWSIPTHSPRPLRRLISKGVRDNMASDILARFIRDGDTLVIHSADNAKVLTAVSKLKSNLMADQRRSGIGAKL